MSKQNPLTVTVKPLGKSAFSVKDQNGTPVDLLTNPIPIWMLRKAVNEKCQLKEAYNKNGQVNWKRVKKSETTASAVTSDKPATSPVDISGSMNFAGFSGDKTKSISDTAEKPVYEIPKDHKDVVKFINDSYSLKPQGLIMPELKWKYLMRSALRGKNIMMVGDSGAGKTFAAKCLAAAVKRPTEIFNLGSTQDPRSFLIGNTHYDKTQGTYFQESLFVKMIRTPNAIIILDEFSRAHPEAHNILMPVLDPNQRYLRLEEKTDSETVKVADGVTFIATANIGNAYTATRVIDKAMFERFIIIEMELLNYDEEIHLLTFMYPSLSKKIIEVIAGIVNDSRIECSSEQSKLTSPMSTRISVEMAGLMFDGFKLTEAAEVAIYPFYEKEGGNDSERVYVKQIVQKYVDIDEQTNGEVTSDSDDNLFSVDEIKNAPSATN